MKPELPAAPAVEPKDDLFDFPELWRTLNRYKWGVLGIAMVVSVVALLVAFTLPKTYRATLTLLIEPKAASAVPVQEVYDPGFGTAEYYFTQYEILKSRDLAGRVVDRLKLAEHTEYADSGGGGLFGFEIDWRSLLPFLPEPDADPADSDPETVRQKVIDRFLKNVEIVPIWRSQLVKVHVEAHDPELAMNAANALGQSFLESGLESRLTATQTATRWLTDKLGDIRTRLEESEGALQAYREANQLVSTTGGRGIYDEELLDASKRMRDAQKRKTELQSTYWRIQQAGGDPRRLADVNSLLSDPLVQRANEAFLLAQVQVKQLEDRYGERHPAMSEAKAKLEAATRAYHEQLRAAAASIKAEYEIAAETERQMNTVLEASKDQIRLLDRKEFEMQVLQREVDANREMYDLFLKRFKETDSAGGYEDFNARVMDPAIRPREAYRPDKLKIVLFAGLGGLILGILLAALRHMLNEGVRSVEELEHLAGMPTLAVLPIAEGASAKRSLPKVFHEEPRTPFAEGVRSIRAALQLSDVDRRYKRILLTSALPQEGKSSLASSLTIALAAMERVLIVECDLRAPSLKRMFDIPPERPGLIELLSGQAKAEECIHHHAATGIYVLPVAKMPPNPAEIVASAAFAKLIEALSARFDRVVIDTPPCQAAADAAILCRHCDVVLFVVKSESTPRRALKGALKSLRLAGAPMLGTVLNHVDVARNRAYYGTYYYAVGYYGR